MTEHLSSQQMSEWTIGQRTPEREEHLRTCAACAAELARLEKPLVQFRGAVRNWSEAQIGAAPLVLRPVEDRRHGFAAPGLRLAAIAAVFFVVAAIPVSMQVRHRRQQVAELARQDEILLRQVEAEVSRSVPAPMQPLAQLMGEGKQEIAK